EAKEEES
ncbi:hypothetical protein CP061683_0817B, partial [Chlamydia psittaci 06-1683]